MDEVDFWESVESNKDPAWAPLKKDATPESPPREPIDPYASKGAGEFGVKSALDKGASAGGWLIKNIGPMLPGMAGARLAESALARAGTVGRVPQVAARMLGAGTVGATGREALERTGVLKPDERTSFLRKFAEEAAGEGIGAGIEDSLRAGAKVARPYLKGAGERLDMLRNRVYEALGSEARLPTRDDQEAIATAQEMLRAQGATLTPAQARPDSPLIKKVERLVGSSGPSEKTRRVSSRKAEAIVTDFVQRLGPKDPRVIGEMAQEAVNNSREIHQVATRDAWNNLERKLAEVGSGVTVDISPLWASGSKELTRAGLGFRPGLRRTAKLIGQEGTDVPTAWGKVKIPELSFEEAQDLRAALREAAESKDPMLNVNQGKAQELKNLLDQQIDAAEGQLRAMGRDDIVEAYDDAKFLTRLGHTQFNNNLVKSYLGSIEPEKVYEGIVKNGSPTRIAVMRKMYEKAAGEGMIPATAWQDVQGRYLYDAMRRSTNEEGAVSGRQLLTELDKMGDEGLDELFPNKDVLNGIRRAARTRAITEKAGEEAMGMNILQMHGLYYLTIGGGYLAGDAKGAAIAGMGGPALVVFGPTAFGRLWNDPVFVDNLIKGWSGNAATVSWSRVVGRLILAAEQAAKDGADVHVNPEAKERVDPETGELRHSLKDVVHFNRPGRVELPPDATDLRAPNPAAQRLDLLFGRSR